MNIGRARTIFFNILLFSGFSILTISIAMIVGKIFNLLFR